eukprot:TRINITY_DN3493_c0_g1_i14.p1 TRINITY_DN3493_c0_g1~~TRINITY_DN3493_c0_g1_i14.p1  ORF type:complete len:343 (-),score=70.13 TRINITY_DN3493_c0_g1_i14:590-1549(-)
MPSSLLRTCFWIFLTPEVVSGNMRPVGERHGRTSEVRAGDASLYDRLGRDALVTSLPEEPLQDDQSDSENLVMQKRLRSLGEAVLETSVGASSLGEQPAQGPGEASVAEEEDSLEDRGGSTSGLVGTFVLPGCPEEAADMQAQCSGLSLAENQGSEDAAGVLCCTNSAVELPAYGCRAATSLSDAAAICREADARLCTKQELEDGKQCNSGCGFDHMRVWTSTACGPDAAATGQEWSFEDDEGSEDPAAKAKQMALMKKELTAKAKKAEEKAGTAATKAEREKLEAKAKKLKSLASLAGKKEKKDLKKAKAKGGTPKAS